MFSGSQEEYQNVKS